MTTLPLEFQLDSKKSTVRLFGLTQPITSNSLATNVSFVQWDGITGVGKITYNDRLPLPEQFTDPSPYQTYVNQWMTAGANLLTNPLSLAQAQAVKSSLIDSIWAGKRQAPISVTTSLGAYSFDASDVLSGALNIGAWLPAVASIITEVNAINSDVASAIASLISYINSGFTSSDNQINSYTSTLTTQLNANWHYFTGNSYPVPDPTQSASSISVGAIPSSIYSEPAALTTLTSPVKMLPIGSTSYPAFTLADLFAVLTAVQTQRANELAARATKQAAVAALTTVANVIVYDATTGW
jgi:hypothetical protein